MALGFFILIWYYLARFIIFNRKESYPISDIKAEAVSIIICARNERAFLESHLPEWLTLDYPDYEVIVMNDCSWDGSKDLLEEMEKKYDRLKAHHLDEENLYQHDKKFPLTLGIKAAKNEVVLLTDADCVPKSKYWIQEMLASYHQPECELVIGYGAYQPKPGLLNKMIRFDTFLIALQYFSSTLRSRTYMATGRNLSYKKSLFFRNKGFASHNHIRSGDDDLFINRVANKRNTFIQFSQNSHTLSVPKSSFSEWINQKRRHVTTAVFYKTGDKLYIGMYFMAQILFFGGMLTSLIFSLQWIYPILGLFLMKNCIQIIIFKKSMEKLDEKDLFLWVPILEIFLMFFYLMVHTANLFSKQPKWK